MSPPSITFGPARRVDSAGQTQVVVRFGWETVGNLCRWHADFLRTRHGWFFETNSPLARACFDFGFPPARVNLRDAKADLIQKAKSRGLA